MDTGVGGIRSRLAQRGWPVTSAPSGLLSYLFAGEIVTLGLVSLTLVQLHPSTRATAIAALFTVMAVAFEEGVRRAARLEMRLSSDLKRDMTSVWTVSSAVVLQPGYAVMVVAALTSYVWVRQHKAAGRPLYRGLFNISTWILGTLCAAEAVRHWSGMWSGLPWAAGGAVAVLVAMAVYTLVNRLLISIALLLAGAPVRELRGTSHDNLIELATLCLGGLVGVAALHTPWLCVLVLAPMVTLQRGALVRELEAAATIDAKTGLLNAVAWEHLAQRELGRADREGYDVGILIIDIDRFKLVNDLYGHLVGDQVLQSVGKVLAAEVREYDTVGRFGGEEFVAVLPNAGDADALVVAERLRSRINELRVAPLAGGAELEGAAADHALAVSIGVACSRHDGTEVADLLVAADSALYRAKAGGRNRVVLAERGTGGAPDRVPTV
jgi:diguanylate cyclase (GGDEF)-like protein